MIDYGALDSLLMSAINSSGQADTLGLLTRKQKRAH